MPVLVAGSIATDHLMHFPGQFSEQLLADQLHQVSLSFLVDDLVVRRGGVAPNICFGMAQLGGEPVLVGAVGEDFDEYRQWLARHGVDCDYVYVSSTHHTARFVCTTDEEMCQIGSFYAGAMSAVARDIRSEAWHATGADLAVISAYDPDAMVQHSAECRDSGLPLRRRPVPADRPDGGDAAARSSSRAPTCCSPTTTRRTCWSPRPAWTRPSLMDRVGVRVTTLGSRGVEIVGADVERVHVPVARERAKADPTGVGDAFRAGLLTARGWGLSWERSAQVGSLLATLVLETVGTQEYQVKPASSPSGWPSPTATWPPPRCCRCSPAEPAPPPPARHRRTG